MRNAFINTTANILKKNKDVIVLNGDAGYKIFEPISSKFKSQYINCGIAEANMISMAAGLARSGFTPFAYAIGAHIVYRAFEQIRNDICLNNTNVKIISGGTGIHYADHGPTHHSTEDISILNSIPNLTIFSPSSPFEVEKMTNELLKIKGPVYMRIGRGSSTENEKKFDLNKNTFLMKGNDGLIICTGPTAITSHEIVGLLRKKFKINLSILNIHKIKPLEKNSIIKYSKKLKKIITIEEHQMNGGLRDIIANVILSNNVKLSKFLSFGLKDEFCSYNGSYTGIRLKYKLDTNYLTKEIAKNF